MGPVFCCAAAGVVSVRAGPPPEGGALLTARFHLPAGGGLTEGSSLQVRGSPQRPQKRKPCGLVQPQDW